MQDRGVHAGAQTRFSALLRYYGHGDFARFCRAADLAYGLECTQNQFFSPNLLLAAQITGICEVTTAGGSTEWWTSHSSDISINSRRRKEIGASDAWFRSNEGGVVPLVIDAGGAPLILGKVADASAPGCFFDRSLEDILPKFEDIERQLFKTGSVVDDPGRRETEIYCTASGRWIAATPKLITGPKLLRSRDQYSGWSLYIQHAEVGLGLRITQPEWAFVTAYHVLPWAIENLYRVRGSDIEFYRPVRLPAIMLRTLFAAASAVTIGPTVRFRDVHEVCVTGINNYFANARGLKP
jgi:hypothetical protein